MKLRDLLNQWMEKNPGWLCVIAWVLFCLLFYIVIFLSTQLMIAFTSSIPMIFITALAIIIACSLLNWRDIKKRNLKVWQWLVLSLIGAVLLTVAVFVSGCIGLFIMTGPVSSLVCTLIGGSIITAAMFINVFIRKK